MTNKTETQVNETKPDVDTTTNKASNPVSFDPSDEGRGGGDGDIDSTIEDSSVVSTEKADVSTEKAVVSTEKADVSTGKAIVSTEKAVVSTEKADVSTGKAIVSTEKVVVSTEKVVVSDSTVVSTKKAPNEQRSNGKLYYSNNTDSLHRQQEPAVSSMNKNIGWAIGVTLGVIFITG